MHLVRSYNKSDIWIANSTRCFSSNTYVIDEAEGKEKSSQTHCMLVTSSAELWHLIRCFGKSIFMPGQFWFSGCKNIQKNDKVLKKYWFGVQKSGLTYTQYGLIHHQMS